MDFLLAKLKGRGDNYAKLLTNKTMYDVIPDFSHHRAYDDDYKLHDDEWFVVENFSRKPYCPTLITAPFDILNYSYLHFEGYKKVDFTIAVQGEDEHCIFIFQNVTPSSLYAKYKAIAWNRVLVNADQDQPNLIENDGVLVIKETPDCYYVKETDNLYFKNLSAITTIFVGINELYKDATDGEVDALLAWPELQIEGGFDNSKVKTANRRKIKEAIQRYNSFDANDKILLSRYISTYCSTLIDNATQKYKIGNEANLTDFLNCINQRYYTTTIQGIKRLANSVTDI